MIRIDDIRQLAPSIWEIPQSFRSDMLVPARVYASTEMIDALLTERSLEQLINVATLPGIERYALAMPDIHQGYGFPIGGVAAIRSEDGVISPGGVGYDINCGVRLIASTYHIAELKPKLDALATEMQRNVPSGVGRGGYFNLNSSEFDEVLNHGVKWALKRGYALDEDLAATEEHGCFESADASHVSDKAKSRGSDQLGTLGAGNHFLEIQIVEKIYDAEIARAFGLFEGQIAVMIHTGSRGLGHQVCTEYVRLMMQVMPKYHISLPDRELACTPFQSEEGKRYFHAMAAAANFALVNRQLITYQVRRAFQSVLGQPRADLLRIVYDVAHNIATLESYAGKEYIIHRKGATRAFGPGEHSVTAAFRSVGQPVLIPGSMGTCSYVLAGTRQAMQDTFGSCCHGAGRRMSRTAAKKHLDYSTLLSELKRYGVIVRAGSARGLLEEAPQSYKDVNEVVRVVAENGIARIAARLKPVAVVKG